MGNLKCDHNCWKSAFLVVISFLLGWFLCCTFCGKSCDAYSGATYGKDCKKKCSSEQKKCCKSADYKCSKKEAVKKCSKKEAVKKCSKKEAVEKSDESADSEKNINTE